eukprot:SAG22_NODE_1411_length_4480_cov_1.789137_3_plen_200_part_00
MASALFLFFCSCDSSGRGALARGRPPPESLAALFREPAAGFAAGSSLPSSGGGGGHGWGASRPAQQQQRNESWNEQSDFIAHYMQALQARPTDPSLHNVLGVALAKQGALEMAIKHYNTALLHDASFFPAHYNLGRYVAACLRRACGCGRRFPRSDALLTQLDAVYVFVAPCAGQSIGWASWRTRSATTKVRCGCTRTT